MVRLSVRDLGKSFGARALLCGVAFEAAGGETVALFGPSGCGKTTLLRILAGLEHADRGEIVFDGRTFNSGRARTAPEVRGVGMVFQGLALWPHMTVETHLDFVLRGCVCARRERETRIGDLLDRFGLAELAHVRPAWLSGGEQQRLALARALACGPPLLLLDEPFSHLDESWRARVIGELWARKRAGTVLVMATHHRDDVRELADVTVRFSSDGTSVVRNQ